MKRALLLAFVAAVLYASDPCPYMLQCDLHDTQAFQEKDEYINGKRIRIYKHTYIEITTGKQRICRFSVVCDKR